VIGLVFQSKIQNPKSKIKHPKSEAQLRPFYNSKSKIQNPKSLPVIRIPLRGRTGNIMFQYALGRALAEKYGVPLVLDASRYNAEGWEEVSHFLKLPIRAKVIRRFSLASRALRKFCGKHYWEYLGFPVFKESEIDQRFDPSFTNAHSDCMIYGFFQSHLYFENIADDLRAEFKDLLASQALPDPRLAFADSVAVHVRRGDYLHHPALSVCDTDYYRRAMEHLRNLLNTPRFFIFSDDPVWCRGEFQTPDTEVIDSGKMAVNPLHDMQLMSQASHHIIANSSYSWWAAWIGEKPGQQVIMPDRWFAHSVTAPIEEKRPSHWTIV
jgi:hypothetical protein